MTCEFASELLSAYVDAQLGSAERSELVSHLEACHGCRREWVGVERARMAAIEAAPSMPMALRSRIERSIEELAGEEAGWSWRDAVAWPALVPAPAWAVLAAVLVVGGAAYSFLPKEEPVPLDRLLAEHVLTDQQTWAAARGWVAASFDDTAPSEEGG